MATGQVPRFWASVPAIVSRMPSSGATPPDAPRAACSSGLGHKDCDRALRVLYFAVLRGGRSHARPASFRRTGFSMLRGGPFSDPSQHRTMIPRMDVGDSERDGTSLF